MNFHRDLYFDWRDESYILSESFENIEDFHVLHLEVNFCFDNGYCESIEEFWIYDPLIDNIIDNKFSENYTVIPESQSLLTFSLLVLFVLILKLRKNQNKGLS